jgi:hypothetical protein
MATPMEVPGVCASCFWPDDSGTYDVLGPYEAVRVNICIDCRMWDNALLVQRRAAYEGNGHEADCPCLECVPTAPTHVDNPPEGCQPQDCCGDPRAHL